MRTLCALFVCTTLFFAGCTDPKSSAEFKDGLKEQREAQKATEIELRKTTEKVNELLVRNEQLVRQLDKLADLEKKLDAFEEKRLEALKEATKPRNTTVESAIESALKLTVLTDPKIRQMACPLLSRLGGKNAEQKLLDLLKTDRDATVRSQALKGLVDMESSLVTGVLNEGILTANEEKLLLLTEFLVSHCDESSRKPALAVLQTLKEFENRTNQYRIRQNLYKVLAKVGKKEDAQALKYFLEKERSKTAVMDAMLKIDKQAAVEQLNQSIISANKRDVRQLALFLEKYANESSREGIFSALDQLIVSSDYEARQARSSLYKALAPLVKPDDNLRIEKYLRLETSDKRLLLDVYVKSGKKRKKEVFTQLARSADSHHPLSKEAFVSLSTYADIRATDFLVKYLKRHNDYYSTPIIINTLVALKDPKAAPALVEQSLRGRSATRSLIMNAVRDGYPGVVYDTAANKLTLVPKAKMDALMEARQKRLIKLETDKADKSKDGKKPSPEPIPTE